MQLSFLNIDNYLKNALLLYILQKITSLKYFLKRNAFT